MHETRSRLASCFCTVFPNLSSSEVPVASMSSVGDWDSLATIKLFAVIEEEFGIQVPVQDSAQLVSFELILDYLQQRHHAS